MNANLEQYTYITDFMLGRTGALHIDYKTASDWRSASIARRASRTSSSSYQGTGDLDAYEYPCTNAAE